MGWEVSGSTDGHEQDGLLSKSELNLLTDNVRRLAGIEGDVLTALQSSASAGAAMSSEGTISLSKFPNGCMIVCHEHST